VENVEIFIMDFIKLKLRKEFIEGHADLGMSGFPPLSQARSGSASDYMYGPFRVSETSADDSIILRPVQIDGDIELSLTVTERPAADASLHVLRHDNADGVPAYQAALKKGEYRFRLSPVDGQKYVMHTDMTEDEAADAPDEEFAENRPQSALLDVKTQDNQILQRAAVELERRIAELSAENAALEEKRRFLSGDFDRLREEYEKNKSAFDGELEELKAQFNIDADILSYYRDKTPAPVGELMARVREGIEAIEVQIRLLVSARREESVLIDKKTSVGAGS
jgi:hypothetical protein